jgi:hypothetical protein
MPSGGCRVSTWSFNPIQYPIYASYKQALNVKITEISEKVLKLNPLVSGPRMESRT